MNDTTIEVIRDDLLNTKDRIIAHCCNTRNAMNSGVAKCLRNRFPEIYEVDTKLFELNPDGRLGHCELISIITKPDETNIAFVANLYGQKNYGYEHVRYIDYEAFYTASLTLSHYMGQLKIRELSMPYKIGCGLAGGEWSIVEPMLKHIFNDPFKLTLYAI